MYSSSPMCAGSSAPTGSHLWAYNPEEHNMGATVCCLWDVSIVIYDGCVRPQDRLCGLVVRVPGYRFRGAGSIPSAEK
jgi:hypothetical protein